MKNFAFIFLLILFIAGCQKEETTPPNNNPPVDNRPLCEKNNQGEMTLFSGKSNPYKVYVGGDYKGTVAAYGSFALKNVASDCYSVRIEQASGFIVYPTVYNANICVLQCKNTEYSF